MNQIFMSKLKTRPLEGCPGRLLLERLVAHELPPEREKALRRHAASCGLCQPLLTQLEAEQRGFGQSSWPERLTQDLQLRLEKVQATGQEQALRAEVAPWFRPEALVREPLDQTLDLPAAQEGERHFLPIPEQEQETVLPTGRKRLQPSLQPPKPVSAWARLSVRRMMVAAVGLGLVLLVGGQLSRSGLLGIIRRRRS